MAREYKINASDYLQELGHSGYEIVNGEPDIRGWTVKNQQGQTIGEVAELLFDAQARKVRYLIVDLEGNVLDLEPRHVVVPIGLAQLQEKEDDVLLPAITATQLQMLPRYDRDTFTPEIEENINRVFSGVAAASPSGPAAPASSHQQYDSSNLYSNRKAQIVIGLFPDAGQAQRAVAELVANGFSYDNLESATRSRVDPDNGYDSGQFDKFFDSLFIKPGEARRYHDRLQNSNAIVAVHTPSPQEARRAAGIMDGYDTVNLNEPADQVYSATTAPVAGSADAPAAQDPAAIPVIEEKVEIGKQEVETGGVRLHSRILERPVEENLRLREERVRIERVPVDRPASDADLASFQEGSIELKEHAEVPVINKEARVVEEVNLEKEVEERDETIQETVRKTDVQVDRFKNEDTRQDPGV